MELARVVAATDFSPTADACVRWAARRLAPVDEIVLVHALEAPSPGSHEPWTEGSDVATSSRAAAKARLDALAASLHGARFSVEVADGAAHTAICRLAVEREADLIVVGPHGERHGTSRWFGTTADRIVRTTEVPVLVGVRGARIPRRLVAAVDDSTMTPTVLAWARLMADRWDAEVLVLHVLSDAVYGHMMSMAAAVARDDAAAEVEVRQDLHADAVRWLRDAVEVGIPRDHVDADVVHGKAGEEILRAVRRWRGDLVIVGQHGAGRVHAPLLGSAVRTVLHAATCPVLVVTPPTDTIV